MLKWTNRLEAETGSNKVKKIGKWMDIEQQEMKEAENLRKHKLERNRK